jgi:hypothetical protein
MNECTVTYLTKAFQKDNEERRNADIVAVDNELPSNRRIDRITHSLAWSLRQLPSAPALQPGPA